MNQNYIKLILALTLVAVLTTAYAFSPAKTQQELIVDVTAPSYEVIQSQCTDWCHATLKGGEFTLELDYKIIDGEVEQIDDVKASIHGEHIPNIYIDRNEYSKISSAVRNHS